MTDNDNDIADMIGHVRSKVHEVLNRGDGPRSFDGITAPSAFCRVVADAGTVAVRIIDDGGDDLRPHAMTVLCGMALACQDYCAFHGITAESPPTEPTIAN